MIPDEILGVAMASFSDILATLILTFLFIVIFIIKPRSNLKLGVSLLLIFSYINFIYPWPQPWHYRFYLYLILLVMVWHIALFLLKRSVNYVAYGLLIVCTIMFSLYCFNLDQPLVEDHSNLIEYFQDKTGYVLAQDLSVAIAIDSNTNVDNLFVNGFYEYNLTKLNCAAAIYAHNFNLNYSEINMLLQTDEYHFHIWHYYEVVNGHKNTYEYVVSLDCNPSYYVVSDKKLFNDSVAIGEYYISYRAGNM